MNDKPRIFIGSSTEFVNYARAVHMFLNNKHAHTKLWEIAIEPGDYTLPSLYKTFHEYDFGIFIFSPDDVIEIRERTHKIVRDNVLFEFGLFLGINGLNNAFIITPEEYLDGGRIPSDLFGITLTTFDSRRPEEELIDSISSSCLLILAKIQKRIQEKEQHIDTGASQFGILEYEGDMLSKIIDMLSNSKKKVIFVITSVERMIVFDLVISIVYAGINNVEIDVHYYPLVEDHIHSFSKELLRQLGCNVKEYPIGVSPEEVAFVADPDDINYSTLIIKTAKYTRKNVYAFYYKSPVHSATINSYVKNIPSIPDMPKYTPSLKTINGEEFLKVFNNIPLYATSKCKFSLIKVKPKDTLPQSYSLIKEYKLKQTLLLISLFTEFDFNLYVLRNGEVHYIVPPVIEEHNGKYLIAEGHTRLFNHLESNTPITCVLVKGMKTPLPSEPKKWDKTIVASYNIPKEFIPSATYLERFRKIESFTHKPNWFT
jgi:predicted nucleotide-binding protein